MLEQLTTWLLDLVKKGLKALWDFFIDLLAELLDLVLAALVSLLSAIPLPAFMQGGLQSLFQGLEPGVIWIVDQAGLFQALGILGAGFAFRIGRKVLTLFQW